MEKSAGHCNMELMKMAMFRPEETFRRQEPHHSNARHLNSGI